jgi:YD repeat-containing protein
MTSQTTPEGGTVNFTYKDFGAVQKRTDPRGVETHYGYDALNRLNQVWYTGIGGSDDPTVVPRGDDGHFTIHNGKVRFAKYEYQLKEP